MDKNEIVFTLFYGAISIAGIAIVIYYWYQEIYKKRNKKRKK